MTTSDPTEALAAHRAATESYEAHMALTPPSPALDQLITDLQLDHLADHIYKGLLANCDLAAPTRRFDQARAETATEEIALVVAIEEQGPAVLVAFELARLAHPLLEMRRDGRLNNYEWLKQVERRRNYAMSQMLEGSAWAMNSSSLWHNFRNQCRAEALTAFIRMFQWIEFPA